MFQKEIFALRLNELSKQSGITGETLADACSVTPAAISQLKRGKRSPSVEVLCTLADLFGVPVDYLAGNDAGEPAKETDPLYVEVAALSPREREEVLRFARFVKANPR